MKNVMIFALGAAVGSLITWKFVEKKYKQIADEEIESVIEHFKNKDRVIDKCDEIDNSNIKTAGYSKIITNLGYDAVSEEDTEDGMVTVELGEEGVRPYLITPEEFGELDDYDVKTWMYYADKILVDDLEQIVGDYEQYIDDALTHFGEYDDSIYVRNENIKCDYEILLSEKTFDEANGTDY